MTRSRDDYSQFQDLCFQEMDKMERADAQLQQHRQELYQEIEKDYGVTKQQFRDLVRRGLIRRDMDALDFYSVLVDTGKKNRSATP